MILDLVRHDHPAITSVSERFDFGDPGADPVKLARDLAETMLVNGGIGLSAPQVGLNVRVVAVTGDPIRVMFNPRIVDSATTTVELEEACLTFPGIKTPVPRSVSVRVRYTRPNGEVVTEDLVGMTARVVQHEIDHLDGITILDRAVGLRKKFLRKKWDKIVKRAG